MTRARHRLLGSLALSGLFGCGGSPELQGSLSTLMSLAYDRAEVAASAAEASVKFLKTRGDGEDIVLQVSARLDNLTLEAGTAIDLAEELSPSVTRGTLARNVLNDPRRTFPAIQRGLLTFKQLPESGKTVNGQFSTTFAQCTEAACGRTVYGDFQGAVP